MSDKILDDKNKLTAADLTDAGICPTCYDREHNHCIFGDSKNRLLFENDEFECSFVGSPRAIGHTVIVSKKHYKDMLEIPDELCNHIFIFARNMMKILKTVYQSESVYLCTMCDGPMNHFHLQLIPRYSYEKRGSSNFVKPRFSYVEDKEKLDIIRKMINDL